MRWRGAMFLSALAGLGCAVGSIPAAAEEPPTELEIAVYAPLDGSFPACTHILFAGGSEIVTAGSQLLARNTAADRFAPALRGILEDAHSTAFDARRNLFYACDSGHHRMVTFTLGQTEKIDKSADTLAGIQLDRPHDVIVDADHDWIYVLNPNRPTLLRFRQFGEDEQALELPKSLGYSRALSLVDGVVYVVASSAGAVVEIQDFAQGAYILHRSHGKVKDAPAGSWSATGLVLNDVDRFDGYWYATSYFCPTYAAGTDCNQNKLIRFRNWDDLAHGRWQDLSRLLPENSVPYYLTPTDDGLFLAVFSHEEPGRHDRVYRLTVKHP